MALYHRYQCPASLKPCLTELLHLMHFVDMMFIITNYINEFRYSFKHQFGKRSKLHICHDCFTHGDIKQKV